MILIPRYQTLSPFYPGAPRRGYYNNLRGFARKHVSVLDSRGAMGSSRRPAGTNIVTIAQVGLGAWQLSATDLRWRSTVADVAWRLSERMNCDGLLPYDFPMPHTYHLEPPWHSAMAQGQAGSLLVRAGYLLDEPAFLDAAGRAVQSLLERGSPLVAETPEGPVLQEYPTDPPAHVLNGWIFALWGLFDVASALLPEAAGDGVSHGIGLRAQVAFEEGVRTLAQRLPLYQLPGGWSRYDLYPHARVNVASPFYHHLHRQQLHAMTRLVPLEAFRTTARVWDRAAANPVTVAAAVAGKIQFRWVVKRRWRS